MMRMTWWLPLCLLPAACAAPLPPGPTVLAVPGKDKSFAQFQQDEGSCRNYAQSQIGPTSPAQAATDSGVASAAVGTALGAAAGAAIGAAAGNVGAGAAIGAASGLALGAGAGASNAAISGGAVQQRYDFSYIQCMTAKGENVQTPAPVAYGYPPYPYPYAYGPYPYPYPGYVVGGPVVEFGFGGYRGYYGRRF
jgi:hypothetical protein